MSTEGDVNETQLRLFGAELIDIEGKSRAAASKGLRSQRILSAGHERVGLWGEWEFARMFDMPFNWKPRKGGDGGFDFTVPLAYTVNVKTARKANNLINEIGKFGADIYMLAEYDDAIHGARLLGWEFAQPLMDAPVKKFKTGGPDNHFIEARYLRSVNSLLRRRMRMVRM